MIYYLHLGRLGYLLILLLVRSFVYAQAPSNLGTNVPLTAPTETDFAPSGFFSSTAQIVAAFNTGRRSEETQLGLTPNSLGNLVLPSSYATLSDNQRALYLINAERQARAGINYGMGPVLGKTLEGVETALDNTAQSHADYLFSTNTFGHTGSGGSNPFQRVEATYPTNCLQRNGAGQYTMGRSENIYRACGGGATYAVEQAIFSWLYQDSGSLWGHREAVLIQNVDASNNTGYTDDRPPVNNEGFLGIGVKIGTGYTPCGSNPVRLVVMNIADPSNDASCPFSVEANPLPVSLLFWTGSVQQKTTKLEWATAWEKNADYFIVQRSTDLQQFDNLGEVKAKGTTQERQTYFFVDETPTIGYNYYRLIQVDFDRKNETSRIISVYRPEGDQIKELLAYPNPVESNTPFRLAISDTSPATIQLLDNNGLEVATKQWRINNKELAVQPITSPVTGLYSIVVYTDGIRRHAKLIVR